MAVPIYVVDAFTDAAFSGNPAGVCLLDSPRSDFWMANVAAEMRHAETAFVLGSANGFSLRWFTPTVEVDLCGHATLASAHVLWQAKLVAQAEPIRFQTRSGVLTAQWTGLIQLDFPNEAPDQGSLPFDLPGIHATWTGRNRMDWIVELGTEQEVAEYEPDFERITALGMRGLILTSRSNGPYDFVSRFFAPQSGVPEDPVTGSAHCCLAPYWAARLEKNSLIGFQASKRGGVVEMEVLGERVSLRGNAVTVLKGDLLC